jgi:hypothetical protein
MMMQKINQLRRDRKGTATIELALVTPILLTLALAGIDIALGYVHKLEVQQHAQIGADYVMSEMENVPTNVEIKTRVHEGSGLPLSAITIERWIECDGEKNSLPACLNAGFDYTQYLSIEVEDDYTPILDVKGYADFVDQFTATGSVTLQVE